MFSRIIKESISFINNVAYIYIFWISLHYISAHLYSYYCTPMTFIGFLSSPFIATLPQCKMMRWVIEKGGVMIEVMWIVLGKCIIEKMLEKRLMPE